MVLSQLRTGHANAQAHLLWRCWDTSDTAFSTCAHVTLSMRYADSRPGKKCNSTELNGNWKTNSHFRVIPPIMFESGAQAEIGSPADVAAFAALEPHPRRALSN
jgi:hypothetical protein